MTDESTHRTGSTPPTPASANLPEIVDAATWRAARLEFWPRRRS